MADRLLTGVLLVGGASRRFGSAKALARLGGETLAERGWRVLGEALRRAARGRQGGGRARRFRFPLLDDGSEVRAPGRPGSSAGLRTAAHEVCVVLPVDCPLMTPAALRALGAACRDASRRPETRGRSRRLPAHRPARSSSAASPSRELRPRDALAELDVARVALDPALLANGTSRAELGASRRDLAG